MSSQSASPEAAVDDWTLNTVNTSLNVARQQCRESITLVNKLVWQPTNNEQVDNLVLKMASMVLAYDEILPGSRTLVCNLQNFLEHYTKLSFEEFVGCIPDMIKESKEYADQANEVAGLHKTLGGELDAVNEVARGTGSSLQENKKAYQEEQEAQIKKLREIFHRRNAAIAVIAAAGVCIDVVGGFGAGSAAAAAANFLVHWYFENKKNDRQRRVDETVANLQIVNDAIETLSSKVSLCICQFRNAMATLADFFTLLHHELVIYDDKLGRLLENPVETHYKLVKSKANEIIKGCQAYAATSSEMQIDLRMIARNPKVTADRSILPTPLQDIIEEYQEA